MNANAPVRAANTFLKKISPKTVCEAQGIDLANLPKPIQRTHLYDLFGVIRGAQLVADRSGQGRKESIRFRGKFQAVTPDGIEFDGVQTFIPSIDEVIYETLKEAQEANAEATMRIGLSIWIKPATPGKPSATGYEFDVQRITQPVARAPDDPIVQLRAEAEQIRQARLKGPETATPPANGADASSGDTSSASSSESARARKGHPSSTRNA